MLILLVLCRDFQIIYSFYQSRLKKKLLCMYSQSEDDSCCQQLGLSKIVEVASWGKSIFLCKGLTIESNAQSDYVSAMRRDTLIL